MPGKEIWRNKCGQQASVAAEGRWRVDRYERSAVDAASGVNTTHKSVKSQYVLAGLIRDCHLSDFRINDYGSI